MSELKDRVAIVTGASNGLGRAIAEKFASEGAKVVLAARSKEKLGEIAAGISERGGVALSVPTDVTKESEVLDLFAKSQEAFGRVDILVNNAGVPNSQPTEEMTLALWQSIVDVNLTAVFLCSREALKIMKAQGGGRIINMGSIAGRSPRAHAVLERLRLNVIGPGRSVGGEEGGAKKARGRQSDTGHQTMAFTPPHFLYCGQPSRLLRQNQALPRDFHDCSVAKPPIKG